MVLDHLGTGLWVVDYLTEETKFKNETTVCLESIDDGHRCKYVCDMQYR